MDCVSPCEQELSNEDEALLLAWYPYQQLLKMLAQKSLWSDDFGECFIVSVSRAQLQVGMQTGPMCQPKCQTEYPPATPLQTVLTYCRMARRHARRYYNLFLTYYIPKYVQTMSWAQLSNPLICGVRSSNLEEELFRAYPLDQSVYYQKSHRLCMISKYYGYHLQRLFGVELQTAVVLAEIRWSDALLLQRLEYGRRDALVANTISSLDDPLDPQPYQASSVRSTPVSVKLAKLLAKDGECPYQHESLLGFVPEVVAPSISRALDMADHYLELAEDAQGQWVVQTANGGHFIPCKTSVQQVFESCGLCRDLVGIVESYWLLPCQMHLYHQNTNIV